MKETILKLKCTETNMFKPLVQGEKGRGGEGNSYKKQNEFK